MTTGGMIVLEDDAGPSSGDKGEWVQLVGPVRFRVKDDDVLGMIGGRRAGSRLASRMAAEVAEEEGQDPELASESEAGRELGFVLGVAAALVTDWEGVAKPLLKDAPEDAPKEPLPFTGARLERMLRSNLQVYAAFDAKVVLPLLVRSMEKNVSAPSPDIISARAGKATAGAARSPSDAETASTR